MSRNIAVVLGSFHKSEALEMLDEIRKYSAEHELNIIEEIWVPGSMEKPLALKKILAKPSIDGAVVVGIIEKGETKHGFVMASSVIDAIINIQLEYMKPVGVGILGPEIMPEQIPPRVRPYARSAATAMNTMFDVMRK
ncbi:MAG: 6,7-dimethyl-8-ribityllumazine synthase [Pseudomonadota bacterium]